MSLPVRMYQHGYLQRRRPALPPEDFAPRWRSHYEIATSCEAYWAPVRRYVQNDVVGLSPDEEPRFDAVGEFFYDGRADRRAVEDAPKQAIDEDADELFAIRPTEHFFGGDERSLSGSQKGPYKAFLLLARRPEVVFERFDELVQDAATSFASEMEHDAAIATGDDDHFAFAATLRVWLPDVGAAREVLQGHAWRRLAGAIEPVVAGDRTITLLTRENVLQDDGLRPTPPRTHRAFERSRGSVAAGGLEALPWRHGATAQ